MRRAGAKDEKGWRKGKVTVKTAYHEWLGKHAAAEHKEHKEEKEQEEEKEEKQAAL